MSELEHAIMVDDEDCVNAIALRYADALDSVIDAWQADAGTNALRNSPAMCRAIAKAREVRGR